MKKRPESEGEAFSLARAKRAENVVEAGRSQAAGKGRRKRLPLEFVHFSSGGSGDVVPISWV
jgi:hypothetical protein